jgi:hypothetical protein
VISANRRRIKVVKEILNKEMYERMKRAFASALKRQPLKNSPGWSGWKIRNFLAVNCTAFLFESDTEYFLIKGVPEEAKDLAEKLETIPLPTILPTI